MKPTTRSAILVTASLPLGRMAANAFAAGAQFDKDYPRRSKVNPGLDYQDKRIRKEERIMASQNGGHNTKQDQKTLYQQEDAVSKRIGM